MNEQITSIKDSIKALTDSLSEIETFLNKAVDDMEKISKMEDTLEKRQEIEETLKKLKKIQ